MNKSPVSSLRPVRWWIPGSIVVLGAIAIAGVHVAGANFRTQISAAISLLVVLLLAFWFVLFTGLPLIKRLILLCLLLVLVTGTVFAVKKFTRVEGSYSGSGFPRLVWKWTPSPDARLPELAPVLNANTGATNVAGATAATAEAFGGQFPQFLGPGRTNSVTDIHLETDWKAHPPVELWRQPIGLGWSSFAIAEGRAITQEQRGDHELIVCYNAADGHVLWAHTNQVRFSESLGGDGPRATPTIVSNQVYALGATGILDCLDTATGQLVWSQRTLDGGDRDNLTWGKSCSPLVYDQLVVVTGGATGPLLVAFHRDTGKLTWQGGAGSPSYASPVLATLAGRRQILIVNAQSVTGHNPDTGAVLWDYPWPGSFPKAAQPVAVAPDKVFISAGYGIGAALLQLRAVADEAISVTEIWRNRNLKAKFANVVIHQGYVYGLDDGILACLDLMTGQRQWKDGRYGHGQVLRVENLLLVQTEPGAIALVEANPNQHRELGRWRALSSKTWNHPALAGDLLLVRNDRKVVCLRLPKRPPRLADHRTGQPRR